MEFTTGSNGHPIRVGSESGKKKNGEDEREEYQKWPERWKSLWSPTGIKKEQRKGDKKKGPKNSNEGERCPRTSPRKNYI